MSVARIIATVFYVGHLRPAPGTWGSLAALPLAWIFFQMGGLMAILVGIIAFYIIGIWATVQVTKGQDDHDPSEVVIDELVGQWIALLPVFIGASHAGVDVLLLWPGWVAGFVLFRLFDIRKPLLVGWADRRNDAVGVMLDDVFAGLFAAVGVAILAAIAHGVLGA